MGNTAAQRKEGKGIKGTFYRGALHEGAESEGAETEARGVEGQMRDPSDNGRASGS
jgi:hypothetical protein